MSSRNNTYRQLNNKISVIAVKLKEMIFGCLDVIIFAALIIAKNLYYGKQIDEYYNTFTLIIPIAFSVLPTGRDIVSAEGGKKGKGPVHI